MALGSIHIFAANVKLEGVVATEATEATKV
jgi:hypothetical protein